MKLPIRRPIGVFDSGIGGLTVVKALTETLPSESIVYFGDTARVPYGTKSKSTVIKFSLENIEFLLRFGVKCIVIACNTASAWALPVLSEYFRVPIIGVIRPGAHAAVQQTRNKRIGVIGTKSTVFSGAYEQAVKEVDRGVKVYSQSCPLFVPLVEEGMVRGPICKQIAQSYLKKIKSSRVDTLILGCTHYPLLTSTIRAYMGPKVILIDSAKQAARDVRGVLMGTQMLSDARTEPKYRFFVTDEPQHFHTIGKRFLGRVINHVERVNGH